MLQSTSTGPVIANAGLSGATAGSLRSWRREPAAQNLSRYRLYPFFGQLNCLAGPYAGLIAFILMARAIGNGVLSFGLVSIPVEIHSAIQDQAIHMHLLHKKCGSRLRNLLSLKVVVERDDLVRGSMIDKSI